MKHENLKSFQQRTSTFKNSVAILRAIVALLILSVTGAVHAQQYNFTTLAGPIGMGSGSADGTGSDAQFLSTYGVAVDASGNVYVADLFNSNIRKISAAGVVTTFAGSAGSYGSADGMGNAARFNGPRGVAVDASGNVYVADTGNKTIRKITAGGEVTTLAGSVGLDGIQDGTGPTARFYLPYSLAVDGIGNVFVADNRSIRKITPDGVVTTLVGGEVSVESADGTGSQIQYKQWVGVAVDASGNVYAADTNYTICKVSSGGVVTVLAGSYLSRGSVDGTGGEARFSSPGGVAVDASGNVYVADTENCTIRKITSAGVVTTLAGSAGSGEITDGTGIAARFSFPGSVAVDNSGNVYVADTLNDSIRKINSAGVVTTLAGSNLLGGSRDGIKSTARFNGPKSVAVDASGNVYVADMLNHTIRKITPAGVATTLAGSSGVFGSTNGTGSAALFDQPNGVAVDASGNVYVADARNRIVRKITAVGVVTTLAGSAGYEGSTDGTGSAARFNWVQSVAVDTTGNVYVVDTFNNNIRKISSAGVVTTLAGKAGLGFSGSADGMGSAAQFKFPRGVAVDTSGNVYVADTENCTIRKITSAGVVTTLAGSAEMEGSADGTGSAARFKYPSGVAVDTNGNVYVADSDNSAIRRVTATGVVTTLAGSNGSPAQFFGPCGVAVDASGNVYVADSSGNRVRLGTPISLTSNQAWLQTYFGTTSGTGTAAPTLDANKNGIPNILEYALGGDPVGNSTGTGILPKGGLDQTAGCLVLDFTRYTDRNDITLTVQAAGGFAGPWTDLARSVNGNTVSVITPGAVVSEIGAGTTRRVSVCDIHQITDPAHPKRFMRLVVSQ